MIAVTVDREWLTAQGMHNEAGNNAAITNGHAWAVGIENPCDLDRHTVLATVVEKQRLGATLSLVVACARPDWVDVAPIFLRLGMHFGVAVHFAGGCSENRCPDPLGEPEHIECARRRNFGAVARRPDDEDGGAGGRLWEASRFALLEGHRHESPAAAGLSFGALLAALGAEAVVPPKSNRKEAMDCDMERYRRRHRVENCAALSEGRVDDMPRDCAGTPATRPPTSASDTLVSERLKRADIRWSRARRQRRRGLALSRPQRKARRLLGPSAQPPPLAA